MRTATGLIALVLLVAGCGGTHERPASATQLTVTVHPKGDTGPATTRTVTDAHGLTAADLAPVAPHSVCTRIYGGPATATVSGRLDGEQVDAHFNLAGGCEIQRWRRAAALLGDPP